MLFFYLPAQLERPKVFRFASLSVGRSYAALFVQILRPDTKVVRGAQGDAGPQIKIDDTTVGASKADEADDWAHMIEIAIHDPGNTAGRSLAYIGLVRASDHLIAAFDIHTDKTVDTIVTERTDCLMGDTYSYTQKARHRHTQTALSRIANDRS